jgi:hypothetical protein
MAQATDTLAQSTFKPISASAVMVLARLAARNAVKEQLRADGVQVSLAPVREINTKANAYLALHQELFDEARERAQRLQMFDKLKRRKRR